MLPRLDPLFVHHTNADVDLTIEPPQFIKQFPQALPAPIRSDPICYLSTPPVHTFVALSYLDLNENTCF
jgi:hypothetical protein